MTFEEVWDGVEVGTVLAVSNGQPQPAALPSSAVFKAWRSNNFTGPLRSKLAAQGVKPRRLRIEHRNDGGVVIAFDVADNGEHTFTLVA